MFSFYALIDLNINSIIYNLFFSFTSFMIIWLVYLLVQPYYIIYKSNQETTRSIKKSQVVRKSQPPVPPKPPKKTWKEKLKKHLSDYKELYIGAAITLSLIIIYSYYGNGDVPPGAPGGELGFNNIGPIGPEDNNNIAPVVNNIGPIGPDVNNIGHEDLLLVAENIDNIVYNIDNIDNISLWVKYFFLFGIINEFYLYNAFDLYNAFHPLLLYLANSQNLINSFNLLPFIVNNNIIDFSLLMVNKYYGSCFLIGQLGQIGFMESNLNFLKELSVLNNFTYQFQIETELEHLNYLMRYATFINYYGIILKLLNQNNLTIDIFQNFSYYQFLGLPLERQELYGEISDQANNIISRYLLAVQQNRFEFNENVLYGLILKVLNEYPECINHENIYFLIFKLLQVFHNNFNLYQNSSFNIIENQMDFQQFYNFYIFLLSHFKLKPCNIIHFYSFLISHNLIEN